MQDQIDESIDMKQKSLKQPNRSPEQKVSLLKLRKNSKSFGDCAIEKQFTIFWFDQEHETTHEFKTNFNENLTIGDICNWAMLKLKDLSIRQIIQDVNLYLPKKKQGKPNEDFPAFRNEVLLKECDQNKFAIKITFAREFTPPRKIEQRTSYSNSLNKKQLNKMSITQPKKKNSNFFCFCSGE